MGIFGGKKLKGGEDIVNYRLEKKAWVGGGVNE